MDDAHDATADEVVYLLAEICSDARGPVHEIGSRARVLDTDGDMLTLAVGRGETEDVVTCSRGLVGRRRRAAAARRPFTAATLPPAA
jgi:hypothetical protein